MRSVFGEQIAKRRKPPPKRLLQAGIRGVKYLDASSRNKPLKDIKRAFLDALPEDAETHTVKNMIGDGTFTPEQDAMLTALAKDDWLGFDYPSQAISAALSTRVSNWDPSQALLDSIEALQAEGTYNYVIFDDADVSIEEVLLQRGEETPEENKKAFDQAASDYSGVDLRGASRRRYQGQGAHGRHRREHQGPAQGREVSPA